MWESIEISLYDKYSEYYNGFQLKDVKEFIKNLKKRLSKVNHHALTWDERNTWVNKEIDEEAGKGLSV